MGTGRRLLGLAFSGSRILGTLIVGFVTAVAAALFRDPIVAIVTENIQKERDPVLASLVQLASAHPSLATLTVIAMPPVLTFCGVLVYLAVTHPGTLDQSIVVPLPASPIVLPPPDTAAVPSEEPPAPPAPRIFIHQTVRELTAIFQDHTELNATQLSADFIGKWMKVSGSVREVSPTFDGGVGVTLWDQQTVTAITLKDMRSAHLSFQKGQRDTVSHLQRNQTIVAVGKLTRITSGLVQLVDCEIVEVAAA